MKALPYSDRMFLEQTKGLALMDLGLAEYAPTYELQQELVAKRKSEAFHQGHDYLLLVEHPDVYTYGRKTKAAPLVPEASVVGIERGGQATFHNPGQLVAYPILKLRPEERDLHLHLRRLEGTIADVLRGFGVQGESRPGATGVWLCGKNLKIASIGVAVSGWVTYHGCALNVRNDLSGFSRIEPCGFTPKVMTSLEQILGENCPTMDEVKHAFINCFAARFERQIAC